MTNYFEITTDRLAETDVPHDHPKTTIENVPEVVASQAYENRRLTAENRILWDLLLFDLPEVEMYEPDDSSTLVEGVAACGASLIPFAKREDSNSVVSF
jgi:hypothetical protein